MTSAANRKPAPRCCGHCVHFSNHPAALEATFSGLSAMSSGYASVKDHDGLCSFHGWYLSYRDVCAHFMAEEAAPIAGT